MSDSPNLPELASEVAAIEGALPTVQADGVPLLRQRIEDSLLRADGDPAAAARLHLIGAHLEFTRGRFEASLTHADAALKAAQESARSELATRARLASAKAWFMAGDYGQVLQELEHLLHPDSASLPANTRVEVLMLLGASCSRLGQHEYALQWQEQACELAGMLGDPRQQARTLTNLGATLGQLCERAWLARDAEQLERHAGRGESVSRQALEILRPLDLPAIRLDATANLACLLVYRGRLDEAARMFQCVDELSARHGLPMPAINCAAFRARLHEARGEIEQAVELLEAAVARAESIEAEAAALELLPDLVRLEKARGRHDRALECHERFHELYARCQTAAAEQRARMLTARLQTERLQTQLSAESQRARDLEHRARTWRAAALVDPLTGLANRRYLDERLVDLHGKARESGQTLALALIDVDDFKQVNDRHSHVVGDAVLHRMGRLLADHCRGRDLAARWGGDEFVLLLNGANLRDAAAACERLRSAVESHDWTAVSPGLRVTVSIGLSDAADQADWRVALSAADALLGTAKMEGRNRLIHAEIS